MSPSPEAHGLGPHVVGVRVVVRRILRGETGPTGGPAMTDLLGVCTAWGPDSCVVQPESGEPVEIVLADIVSGKPVPPRPSTRLRVAPAEAQRRALALWPDLHTEPLGAWLLRRSATETARRANSVLAFEPSGVADDYARVVAFYDRPIAAVLPGSAEDALFRGHGWVAESHDADTLFQLAGVARVRRHFGAIAPERQVLGAPTCSFRAIAPKWQVGAEVGGAEVVRAELVAEGEGEVVASGIAAYDRDWVGFRSIEVSPAHRRRGLGLAVMSALLEWGAERGATTAYLQVLGDNTPALALYDRLGFATHHAYRYLAPPASSARRPNSLSEPDVTRGQ